MILKKPLTLILSILCLPPALLAAAGQASKGDTLQFPGDEVPEAMTRIPMPELGEGRLETILTDYYNKGLGGAKNWRDIFSLKIVGRLKLESAECEITSYRKKPNLIKMNIRNNQGELVLAYDGEDAWQKLPDHGSKPEMMESGEARQFRHSASFGSHLLYPFANGKTIEYIDTVPMEGKICHQIRIKLRTEYQIDYFINIRDYLIVKVINNDLENDLVSSTVYKDYTQASGLPVARRVESYENGEWISTLTVHEIKVNAGIIPFMFEMR